MGKKIQGLTKYSLQKYSQNGEEGMLKEILEKLNITKGFFCDIGAWDGKYLSNTLLLLEQGWKGIEIEGNPGKAAECKNNLKEYDVECLHSFITCEQDDTNINNILKKYNVEKDFDFFTIDIDGNDWWVWKNLDYNPKIVLVEYNSNHKEECVMYYDKNYVHRNNIRYYGASAPGFAKLGIHKGYDLVGINCVNMFFVRKDLNKDLFKVLNINECTYYGIWGTPTDIKMMPLKDVDLNNI